jgi:hypothetical protein
MTKQTSSAKKSQLITAKCNDCGQIVKSNQKFCPGCGAELDWSSLDDEPEEKPATKTTKENSAKTESAPAKTVTHEEKIDTLIQEQKAKLNKWLIVGGVSFLIMFIIVGTTPDGEDPNSIVGIFMFGVVLSIMNIIIMAINLSKLRKSKNTK